MSGVQHPNGAVTITLELGPEAAAGLKRFAEKITWEKASGVLYGHTKADIRRDQAGDIITAFGALDTALEDAGVRSWPWIDTGRAP